MNRDEWILLGVGVLIATPFAVLLYAMEDLGQRLGRAMADRLDD